MDLDRYGLRYGVLESEELRAKAAKIEQEIWDEKLYGNLVQEGYAPHIRKSRTFGAFDSCGNCVGMNRMFRFDEVEHLPFLKLKLFSSENQTVYFASSTQGDTEELGTVAVIGPFRGKRVNLRLWRLAYRDARHRKIANWAIIMEPERVDKLNKYHGFAFRQIGPTVNYQGGECAPFIMSLEEVDRKMKWSHPLKYFWFVRIKLKT